MKNSLPVDFQAWLEAAAACVDAGAGAKHGHASLLLPRHWNHQLHHLAMVFTTPHQPW